MRSPIYITNVAHRYLCLGGKLVTVTGNAPVQYSAWKADASLLGHTVIGASEGNRTLVSGLGSPHSAIEPHSHLQRTKLEHHVGIEPTSQPWKGRTQPICQYR